MRRWFSRALLAAAFGVVFMPAQATAQQLELGGADLHLFRPAIDSKGHFTVNGSDILGHRDFSFGLVLDYGRNILDFDGYEDAGDVPTADASRTSHIVDNYFTGTLAANYGIKNWVVVGFQLPIALISGPAVEVPGFYNAPQGEDDEPRGLDSQGIGDLTLHAKVRFTRAERDPLGFAAVLRLQIPTGDDSTFRGEPGFTVWPSFVTEWRPIRRIRLSGELGYRFNAGDGAAFPVGARTIPTNSTNATDAGFEPANPASTTYDDLLTYGVGASFRIADSLDLVAEVYGTSFLSALGDEGATSIEAIGGLKIFVQQSSYLQLGAGGAITPTSYQAANLRFTAGFVFEPSIGDRDGDGFKDDVDQCINEPEDYDTFADEDGCPDPDNDRDGIIDDLDECPLVPEDRDGEADDDGCPEGNEGDRDGDGILDNVDDCPDDPEDRDGFEDEDGCPDLDNDEDGILDTDDLCPDDPEDPDDWEDLDGCPDPDNDEDRFLDVDDNCPNDPETYNGYADEDGCPDDGLVIVTDYGIEILERIMFETDSAEIQPRSFRILDAVAATLEGNPQIALVEIQGHADERGDDEYNLSLTQDRAASVVEAMVQRGVDRSRLRSAGYGERCPIDPRSNARAWDKNRRVEFKIIEYDNGPPENAPPIVCEAGADLTPN
ncbi:MAG: OmpA family protein [Myxococcota bacterium]